MQTIEVITKEDFDLILNAINEIHSEIKEIRAELTAKKELESVPEREVFNIKEASNIIGIGTQTLRQLIKKREIPYIQTKEGATFYFKKSDLEQWLIDRTKLTNKQISQKAEELLERMYYGKKEKRPIQNV